jgi:transcriptional regulator with XRE-family HTH domain
MEGFQENAFEDELSRRVRLLMWRDNLNQNDTAQRCKVAGAVLSNIINSKGNKPTVGTLQRIANTFNVSLGWLLGEGEITDALKKDF